jgi:hypothetical protein
MTSKIKKLEYHKQIEPQLKR